MNIWLSAQEIADYSKAGKLFGLPKSVSGIRRIANREDWHATDLARIRKGRKGAGGMEYHASLIGSGGLLGLALDSVKLYATDKALLARFILVGLSTHLQRDFGISQTIADIFVSMLINDGDLPLPDCLAEKVGSVSPRTIRRWRRRQRVH